MPRGVVFVLLMKALSQRESKSKLANICFFPPRAHARRQRAQISDGEFLRSAKNQK
jgi:hypothetical protein